MSGRVLPIGGDGPWSGGAITSIATCVLAPNPSPWTLDGTNTWVIRAGGHAVIIDPGPDDATHLAAIRAAVEGARVSDVLLTHGHIDHAQSAVALAQSLGVGVRALDPAQRLGGEGLADGNVVRVGEAAVRVVGTAGHSADSLSFVVDADGSLLTGDTVLGRGTTLVAWPDGRLDDYFASLARLTDVVRDVPIARILPGHGPTVEDPLGTLERYIAHRRERLEQVRDAVARGLVDAPSIVADVYADVPREVWPAAEVTVQAQLEYLGLPAQ